MIYTGVVAVFALIFAIFFFKKLGVAKFFMAATLIVAVLTFDNPISRAIYLNEVPFISTSVAGRMVLVLVFSLAVLTAKFFVGIETYSRRRMFWVLLVALLTYVVIILMISSLYFFSLRSPTVEPFYLSQVKTAFRNLAFPGGFALLIFCVALFRKTRVFYLLAIFVVFMDLARFGWKYEPVVPSQFAFPEMQTTKFLAEQEGIFRIEREKAEIMSPNTWSYYRFQSPSGYDPMAPESSTRYYFATYNNSDNNHSRYAELEDYNAQLLGEDNVKYLLILKRNELGELGHGGDFINWKIDPNDWTEAFSGEGGAILENKHVKPRIESGSAEVKITEYTPNRVVASYKSDRSSEVVLKDAYSPGWNAYFNGVAYQVEMHKEMFRKVNLPAGEGELEFVYQPDSFRNGLAITVVALAVWLAIAMPLLARKKDV